MQWNWQQNDWPHFTYQASEVEQLEGLLLREAGILIGTFKHLNEDDKESLTVDLISTEALKTSQIEGEYLDRDSLQSSIRRQFGLATDRRKSRPAEQGMAELMVDLYRTYQEPLTHSMLYHWHKMVMNGRRDLRDMGAYRTHGEPMQVISGPFHDPKVHFEAPPSLQMSREMEQFVAWFNDTSPTGNGPLPGLTRAGIAHLYFVCIHPFEDGNGRIGRAIAEKVLAQSLGQPTLIVLSHRIEKHKRDYYDALAQANRSNEITQWLRYFGQSVLDAQRYTQEWLEFIIAKTKLYDRFQNQLNPRQQKVLERLFHEGPDGFVGGLSAANYFRIAKTSRATATRDLQDLVDKGALVKTGQLKSTRYYLNL